MSEGELSRMIRLRPLPAQPVMIEASETERAALAKRFGLPRIDRLTASLALADDGKAVRAKGRLNANVTQLCAVSGRSEEHTSELQSLMRTSYAVFCLKKKRKNS